MLRMSVAGTHEVATASARASRQPERGRSSGGSFSHWPKTVFRLGLLGLVALSTAACNGTPAASSDRIPISEQVLDVAAELSALRAQMDTAIGSCMEEDGFPYFGQTMREHFDSLLDLLAIRVLSISVDEARVEGYGTAGQVSSTGAEKFQYFDNLSQAEQDAYSSAHIGREAERVQYTSPSGTQGAIPVGGCVGVGASTAYGSAELYVNAESIFTDLQFLGGEVLRRAEEKDAVRGALNDWSECMMAVGYSFEAPVDAREAAIHTREVLSDDVTGDVTPEEIAIATADARCQDDVSLNQTYSEAVVREQASIMTEKERLFLAWEELMQQVAAAGYRGVEKDSEQLLPGAPYSAPGP
jgi:hypothetical protein